MKRGNQFLLACIKLWGENDEDAAKAVRELAATAPEDALYAVAHDSTLAPVAYHVLRRQGYLELLPDPLRDRLHTFYHFTAARNTMLFRNLKTFLDGAERRGFPVMLLKGVALIAGGYYPDRGLRFLSDLDVLVKLDDVGAADDLLHELGWTAPVRITLDRQLKSHHHLSTVTTPEGIPVEVHFLLSRIPLSFDLKEMWRRAKPLKSLSPAAYLPSPEDLLIHLALNTSMHHPDRLLQQHLKFLADLEALTCLNSEMPFDWEYVFQTAASAGMEVAVLHPLVLSYKLLNKDKMGEVLRKYGALDRVHNDFLDRITDDIREGREIPEISWMVSRMGEAHGFTGKMKVFFRMVFPRWPELAEIYPRWSQSRWYFLAYLLRIGHLVVTFRRRNFSLAYRAGSVLSEKAAGQKAFSSDH